MRGDWPIRIILGFTVLMLCPWPTVLAPAWDLTVVDESGEPVPHIRARQQWFDATAMGDEIDKIAHTDREGRVSFPRRVAWASTAERLVRFGMVVDLDHFSIMDASVYVWDVGYKTGVATYLHGEPLPTLIVMRVDPCPDVPMVGRAARLRHLGPDRQGSGNGSRCIPG
jgi:hypothetical protein